MRFPDSFLWGSSTNAQQFEGGWDRGGKGVSIADVRRLSFSTATPSDFAGFKVASDHYGHMREDIALYGEMGFGIYRFSMAWTRIYPNGDDPFPNEEGLAFYDEMLTELERHGIAPVVTLYAYDMPQALVQKYNSWLSRRAIEDYLRYVETVVTRFQGRVKYWVPFNEQNFLHMDSEYMTGYATEDPLEIFRIDHHFNLAYARATRLIHTIDPLAKVGGNVGNCCVYPKSCNPQDVRAADEGAWKLGYNYADVYFRGQYTARYLKPVAGEDLSSIILPGDMQTIARAEPDFLSTTYYMSTVASAQAPLRMVGGTKQPNPYTAQTEWGWNIDPYGFQHMLEDFYHRYRLPILILENGLGHRDTPAADGTVDDTYRIDYLRDHIRMVAAAMENGVEIIGYLTWSATDLYSTREGFEKRYGFVYVDKDTLQRTPKKSFYWYKRVIASNGEDLED